jgi:hypothetical protein
MEGERTFIEWLRVLDFERNVKPSMIALGVPEDKPRIHCDYCGKGVLSDYYPNHIRACMEIASRGLNFK